MVLGAQDVAVELGFASLDVAVSTGPGELLVSAGRYGNVVRRSVRHSARISPKGSITIEQPFFSWSSSMPMGLEKHNV